MGNDLSEFIFDEDDSELKLPVKKNDLGKFISSLLGTQQSIERVMDVHFDIDINWLINLHELIEQRIHQQATAKLINFNFSVYFSDGTKRLLTDIESFKSYQETSSKSVNGFSIIWSYLVNFPNKGYPEKQEISLSAHTLTEKRLKKELSEVNVERLARYFLSISDRSTIAYNISHTERTWGDDLEVLMSKEVDKIVRDEKLKDQVLDLARLIFALAVLIFCLVYPLYSLTTAMSDQVDIINDKYLSLYNSHLSPSVDLIDRKLNSLKDYLIVLGNRDKGGYSMFLLLLGPILAFFVLFITKRKINSFFVFSNHAKIERDKRLKSENKSFIVIVVAYALTILSGVFGNYIYNWLMS